MLKLIDKITIAIVSCMIVTFTIIVIVSAMQLIDAYVVADEKLSAKTNYIRIYRNYTIHSGTGEPLI